LISSCLSLISAAKASVDTSSELKFELYFLLAVANGFIIPTFIPFFFRDKAMAAAIVVFPTQVSVPATKNPFFFNNSLLFAFLEFNWIGLKEGR
jgi:hypothetical protein